MLTSFAFCSSRPKALVDPVSRTFNWPFLCAMVEAGGSRVPEFSDNPSRGTSRTAAQRKRDLDEKRAAEAEAEAEDDSDSDPDQIMYAGDESGLNDALAVEDETGGDSCESDDDDDTSESDFDEYEDEDSAHIETLVTIAGSSSKYFDTVEWLRTLLFTLQMYVDGYCPDFYCTSCLFCSATQLMPR